MKKVTYTGLLLLLLFALAIPSFAQTPPPRQYKGGPAEYAEYSPLFAQTDPAKKAPLAEKFLADFKGSDYAADVYQMLVQAYNDTQQWPKVIDAADRFEQSDSFKSPFVTAANKVVIFSDAAIAAMQSGNLTKMSAYVDKELAADPPMTNSATLNMLMILSASIANAPPQADTANALNKALDLTNKSQASADKIFGGTMPAGTNPAAWSAARVDINAQIQETFGLIALNQQQYDKAQAYYDTALKTHAKSDVDYYRLGLAYQGEAVEASKKLVDAQTKVNAAIAAKADKPTIDDLSTAFDAFTQLVKDKQAAEMDALAKAVGLAGPAKAPAQAQLEKLWKQANNGTTDGLDAFIASKKPGGL